MKGNWRDITQFISIGIGLAAMITFGAYLLFNGLFPANPNAGLSPETLEQSEKYYEGMKQDERDQYLIDLNKGKVE